MKKILINIIKRLPKIIFNLIMLALLALGVYYISELKTKKYASNTIVLVKNLSSQVEMANSLTSIIAQGTNSAKDAYLLTVYLNSWDMYSKLDKEFNLTKYYSSSKIDYLNRLEKNTTIPFKLLDKENLLSAYNKDIRAEYDDISGTFSIEFAHTSAIRAKKIVEKIVKLSNVKINYIDRENSKKSLIFFKKQLEEKKSDFLNSYKRVILFQNTHSTISPTADIEKYSKIVANLESSLIETNIEYQNKAKFYPPSSDIVKELKNKIFAIKSNIKKVKAKMVGNKKDKKRKKNLSDSQYKFNLLKQNMEITKQLYVKSLLSLDKIRESINKNSKNIIILSYPTVEDYYKYPNKYKSILSYLFIFIFLYAIIIGIFKIIGDHRN